jgi:streptogramin lyase
MRFKMIALALVAASVLLLAVVVSARTLAVEEAPLTNHGKVFEINGDGQGSLYVSDILAREIWQVNASGAYTVYPIGVQAVDARPDAGGNIWWSNGAGAFGRIDGPANTVTTWDVDQFSNLRGLALDGQGHVWLSHFFGPNLYRFEPGLSAGVLCTYTLPGGNFAEYVVYDEDQEQLWLAAWGEQRIYRLDLEATSNQLTYWQIRDASSYPLGATLDDQGQLWWADSGLGFLGRLKPDLNLMTAYSLPLGSEPQMVTSQGGRIWYTEFAGKNPGTVGRLDPGLATGADTDLQATTTSVTPECAELAASGTRAVTIRTGQLSWTSGASDPVYDQDGWTIYQQGPGYKPYGVALQDNYLWTAVQGAQKLVRYSLTRESSLNLSVAPGDTSAFHGQSIHYTYTVTYTSSDNSPANTVRVRDDHCGDADYMSGDDGDDLLAVDETWLFGCRRAIPAHIDGEANPITGTVTATARDDNGQALTPAGDRTAVTLLHHEGTLSMIKSGPASAMHGQTITYTYAISYTSPDDSPADIDQVNDDRCLPIMGPDPAGDVNGNDFLDTDETWLYTCQYIIPDHREGEPNPLSNTGSVTGNDLDGDAVTPGQDYHEVQIEHDYTIYLPVVLK